MIKNLKSKVKKKLEAKITCECNDNCCSQEKQESIGEKKCCEGDKCC